MKAEGSVCWMGRVGEEGRKRRNSQSVSPNLLTHWNQAELQLRLASAPWFPFRRTK